MAGTIDDAPDPAGLTDAAAPAVPAEPLRERRRHELTAEIEHVALALFDRDGYGRVTVDEIAAAAGISRRTFFRYFSTKEDVLAAAKTIRVERIQERLDARPADEPVLASLHAVLRSMAVEMAGDRDRLILRESILAREPELRARMSGRLAPWTDQFVRAVAERLGLDPVTDLRPTMLVLTAGAAFQSALQTWIRCDDVDLVELLDRAFELLARGLA